MKKISTALHLLAPVSITRPRINNRALSSFEAVSEDDILKLLKSSHTKSCDLDPIPTSLVKECRHPNHTSYQYHKLLTQRREFPKLFQNRICYPASQEAWSKLKSPEKLLTSLKP